MILRAALYARYSSDLQSEASIEDQIRLCSERAQREGWSVENCYTDAGLSGSSLMRPGIQALMQDAMTGKFDIVVAEALDRLSRDQEDVAGLYKRMEFAGVKIFTLSEGEISTLHIGLKGTMNALYLSDLADKTRRGLSGRVENGKSGGGLCYGYRVLKQTDAVGEAVRGEREIDEVQAEIVQRIFREYAYENKSPKAIAAQLNKEGIAGPSGNAWGQSTINGNRKRGTGVLNNELYIGQLVWNRLRYIKNPSTGKRVSRFNSESAWIRQSVPELRIVSDELWQSVKARQSELDKSCTTLAAYNRPQYLLSGLLECGVCGGGVSKINKERYGCSSARNKGESVCANKTTIKREVLEYKVLHALQTHLLRDDLVKVFCEEYTRHLNALNAAHRSGLERSKSEKRKLEKEKANIIQAIKDGVPATMVKDALEDIANREKVLESAIKEHASEPRPLIHPAMAQHYRKEVSRLRETLSSAHSAQAREHLRGLIEKIVLTPKSDHEGGYSIDLHGDLAGILSIAKQEDAMFQQGHIAKRPKVLIANDNLRFEPSLELVAGAGFEPTTFGL